MAQRFKFVFDSPPSAESLENLTKTVPGAFAKGEMVLAHLNCAWLVEDTLRSYGVTFRVIPPKAPPRIRWSDVVAATRQELLPWVPDFLATYQKLGVVFALNAPDESGHLHHPTGAGKTITAIVWGLFRPLPIVVITKAAARETIRREFERYTTVRPHVLLPPSERKPKAPDPVEAIQRELAVGASPRAVIVGWESLPTYTELLTSLGPFSLVMDEIHMAKDHKRWLRVPTADDTLEFKRKNNRAAHAQRIARNARRRLGVTATPIPDRTRDWWAQADLVHPWSFGRAWDFFNRYCDVTVTNQGYRDNRGRSNVAELEKRLSFVAHRVDYAVTHRELPPKRRQVLYIQKGQQGRPDAFARELERARKIGRAAAVREVSLAEAASRKRPVLLDYVKDAIRAGSKVVVLTGRHADCERWDDALAKALPGVARWMGHGGHGTSARDAVREAYMAHPGPCILVGTGEAWGESVSLHDTDLAVNAMLPMTPKQLWQREGRFHRQGGKRSVLILYPVAEGTEDERMHEILLSKLPAVADLQQDSDFITAEQELRASGLTEEQIVDALFAKIVGSTDAEGGEDGRAEAEPSEPRVAAGAEAEAAPVLE